MVQLWTVGAFAYHCLKGHRTMPAYRKLELHQLRCYMRYVERRKRRAFHYLVLPRHRTIWSFGGPAFYDAWIAEIDALIAKIDALTAAKIDR